MKIEGLYFKYHGDDWRNSSDMEWSIFFADKREGLSAKKIGTRKLFNQKATIWACDQCPHTFYAD